MDKFLTHEELRAISLRKNKHGCATKEALEAQKILFDQDPCCCNSALWKRDHTVVQVF